VNGRSLTTRNQRERPLEESVKPFKCIVAHLRGNLEKEFPNEIAQNLSCLSTSYVARGKTPRDQMVSGTAVDWNPGLYWIDLLPGVVYQWATGDSLDNESPVAR
jgi:hypothetical protein